MALPNLGAHTDGGAISPTEGTKETASDALDALLDNAMNHDDTVDVAAGGTIDLSTPQANLDKYLGSGFLELTGAPAGAFNLDLPDGDKNITIMNSSGQLATIDTITGATTARTLADAAIMEYQVRGTDIEEVANPT